MHAFKVCDELASDLHRIDAQRGERGMGFEATHRGFVAMLALMRDHHLHAGGLAHDAAGRLEALRLHVGDHAPHADAAHLFVVAESQVHRPLELAPEQLGHHHQGGGAVTLHVGYAPAKHFVALDLDLEGVGVPRLAVDRHHISMTRQHNAAGFGLPVMGRQSRP